MQEGTFGMISDWKCAIRSAVSEFENHENLTSNQKLICAAYFSITKAIKDEYRSDPEFYDVVLENDEDLEILFNHSRRSMDENVLREWKNLGLPKEFFDEAKRILEGDMKRIRRVKDIRICPDLEALSGSETIPPFVEERYTPFRKFFGSGGCSFLKVWERMPEFLEKEFAVATRNGDAQLPLFKGDETIAYVDSEEKEFHIKKDDGRYWGLALCAFLISKNLRSIPDGVVATIKRMLVDRYGESALREKHLFVPLYGATLAAMIYQKSDPESATLKDLTPEMLEKAFYFVESCSTEALLFGFIPVENKSIRVYVKGDYSPDYWSRSPLTDQRKKRREEIQKELSAFFPGLKAARKASRNYQSL